MIPSGTLIVHMQIYPSSDSNKNTFTKDKKCVANLNVQHFEDVCVRTWWFLNRFAPSQSKTYVFKLAIRFYETKLNNNSSWIIYIINKASIVILLYSVYNNRPGNNFTETNCYCTLFYWFVIIIQHVIPVDYNSLFRVISDKRRLTWNYLQLWPTSL